MFKYNSLSIIKRCYWIISIVFLLSIQNLNAQISFTEDTTANLWQFSSGEMSVADLNGDGIKDILQSGDYWEFPLAVEATAISYGTPGFQYPDSMLIFDQFDTDQVKTADLDGDGDQDVIMSGYNQDVHSYSVRFYRNMGDGTFEPMNTDFTASGLREGDMKFADVDGDLDLDMLYAGIFSTSIGEPVGIHSYIYENDGDGNFTPMSILQNGRFNIEAEFGDLDNDGDQDIVITSHGGFFATTLTDIFQNDGFGNFTEWMITPYNIYIADGNVALGDVNGDGLLDILLTGDDTISFIDQTVLYVSDGLGGYEYSSTPFPIINGYSNGAYVYGVADFIDADNDGDLDAIFSGYLNYEPTTSTKIYENNGFGVFTESVSGSASITGGLDNGDLVIVDINEDGLDDFVFSGKGIEVDSQGDYNASSTKIYLNTSVNACRGTTTYTISGGWDNGIPDGTMEAIIAENYNTSINNFEACSLRISALANLTVEAGDYVSVRGDITVASTGSLIVEHEGSLVQEFEGASCINNGTIIVEKATPTMAAQSFMISGSPMTGENREGVFGDSYIVRHHVTENFVPNEAVATAFPLANNFSDDNGDNWIAHTGALNAGEGYLVFPQPNGTSSGSYTQIHTQGDLTSGVVDFPLTFNEPGPTAGDNQNASPNVLANPYASAIDAELFFDDPANVNINVLYFWEHNTPLSTEYPGYNVANYSMSDISLYNESLGGLAAASGGAAPSQFISSGQGFFVKPSAGGTAKFKNAMRVTGPNNTYRGSNSAGLDRIWIHVNNDTYELGSTALIGFTENTSDEYSNSEDVFRLATPISIYSEIETGEQLAINALDTFQTEDVFYLGFSTQVKETQDYRISIQNLEGVNLENVSVYLIDSLTGTVTSLSEGDYSFQSGEASYSKRFKVVFENSVLGTIDTDLEAISMFPNPTTSLITIVFPRVIVNAVIVYDIQGRKVSEVDFRNQTNYQIDLSNLESALYFIEITTDAGKITKRVVKK